MRTVLPEKWGKALECWRDVVSTSRSRRDALQAAEFSSAGLFLGATLPIMTQRDEMHFMKRHNSPTIATNLRVFFKTLATLIVYYVARIALSVVSHHRY
ncbi:hypothetical protein AUEXF2481DRAFT_622184 [Aureobasidium subglaciale EXF-2481]|uniref:Uncharacterized protein n=1 Tax=Aureobasidium subglaciale (strain EXF-2481) TaxID=1043005 RepID=A0A074YLK6_AURSE|nr:uncharacterized protein AUEXF2481DRAFT_622184 [Aureobasidium subglaciale EXF-2481]KEQ96944.1 hypothetical protein AUEXF2481DRAFT_622184 [Aureobasidium subglaciale EXF-2481]